MMFDDFMSTGMQSLDYDRVVRCAVTIQTDGDVCNVLSGSAPVPLDECWIPDDAWITDMCFAFSSTEGQLTARSYPEHDILPPAMTLLVERGSEKRTGIKSQKQIRPKPPSAPQPNLSKPPPAGFNSSRDRPGSSSSRSARMGSASSSAAGAADVGGPSGTKGAARGDSPKKSRKGKASPKTAANDAASLLADPRPKPTGQGKSKVKPLNLVRG